MRHGFAKMQSPNTEARKHMDWDNLRYFLAVARAGKLTAAARRLGQDHTKIGRAHV